MWAYGWRRSFEIGIPHHDGTGFGDGNRDRAVALDGEFIRREDAICDDFQIVHAIVEIAVKTNK